MVVIPTILLTILEFADVVSNRFKELINDIIVANQSGYEEVENAFWLAGFVLIEIVMLSKNAQGRIHQRT